jgi:hypothetical protein
MTTAPPRPGTASLRVAAALLACALATSACTWMLWRDNRSLRHAHVTVAPELNAWRLQGDPCAFVLQLPVAAVDALLVCVPELPCCVEWLEVRPRGDGTAKALAAASFSESPRTLRVVAFRNKTGAPVEWAFEPYDAAIKAPFGGVDRGAYYREAACDVRILASPPALGEPIAVALDYTTRNDDGTPVLARIALTPITLAGDAILVACATVAAAGMIAVLPIAWPLHLIFGDKESLIPGSRSEGVVTLPYR